MAFEKGHLFFFLLHVFVHVRYTKITILSPKELAQRLLVPIDGKYSNFGSIKYGFQTQGKIYYDSLNQEEDYACKPLNRMINDLTNEDGLIPIIMVDRGNCSFVSKVRNVQKIGGQVALIVNNQEDDDTIFALRDDGSGNDISIPGILIPMKIGEIMKEYLQNSTILVQIDNTLQKSPMDTVTLQLDFLPHDAKVYELFKLLRSDIDQMGNHLVLIPNYITRKAYGYDDTARSVYQNCLCYGRHCLYSSQNLMKEYSRDILIESILQKCLYFSAKSQKKLGYYLDYMTLFYKTCLPHNKFSIQCSRTLLTSLNDHEINLLTEHCFLNSFKYEPNHIATDLKNNIEDIHLTCLMNDILEQDLNHIDPTVMKDVLPIITINDHVFYGYWSYENILEVLCAALDPKPDKCFQELNGLFGNRASSSTILYVIGIGILITLGNLVFILFIRKFMKNKISERVTSDDIDFKVNNIVAKYIALKDRP